MEDEYGRDLCVRGYHVYEAVWRAVVGETLACEREPRNEHDRYAVAVKKTDIASAMAADDIAAVSEPFGSGRPSTGFRYFNRAMGNST